MAAITLNKLVPNWIGFVEQCHKRDDNFSPIFFIGLQNSCKSTLCQLFNSYIANNKNPALTIEDGKVKQFLLPNVISTNSLKIQTLKPVIYDIESKMADCKSASVVDLPTYTLPPFNQANRKLWSVIDSKLSFNFMMNSVKKCVFAFVIDQRFTRAPMDGTKSILINFMDSFLSFPKELYDSTVMIITRCPTSGFKLETSITRIQGCIKKLQDPNQKHIDQWFQSLKARNGILTFTKLVTQQQTKKQVISIYKYISELPPYRIDFDQVKSLQHLNQQLKAQIKQFLVIIPQGFGGLINLILQIPAQYIKTQQQYQKSKTELIKNLFKINPSQEKSNKMPTLFNILLVCNSINSLIINGSDKKQLFFSSLLQQFVKFQIISKQQQFYIGLKQRLDLYSSVINKLQDYLVFIQKDTIKKIQQNLKPLKTFKKANQIIKDSFQQGKPVQFYQNLIKLIQFVVPQNLQSNQLSGVWINASLQTAAQLPKPTSLLKFLQIQSKLTAWKRTELVGNLLAKIGEVLMSVNQVGFAVSFYSKCGNPYRGIQEMTKILSSKDVKAKIPLKDLLPYIQLLQDLGLYEKSYETCYQLVNIYSQDQQRKQLRQYLLKPQSKPKEAVIECLIDRKVKGLQEQQVKRLKKLAQDLQKSNLYHEKP